MADMQEPPQLTDREGNRIVVFRDAFGNFFSNHPDYPLALAMHQQMEAAKAAEPEPEPEVVDDEPVEPDNNDGVLDYEELTSKDLITEARARELKVASGSKRSDLIALLKADDAAKAGQ